MPEISVIDNIQEEEEARIIRDILLRRQMKASRFEDEETLEKLEDIYPYVRDLTIEDIYEQYPTLQPSRTYKPTSHGIETAEVIELWHQFYDSPSEDHGPKPAQAPKETAKGLELQFASESDVHAFFTELAEKQSDFVLLDGETNELLAGAVNGQYYDNAADYQKAKALQEEQQDALSQPQDEPTHLPTPLAT